VTTSRAPHHERSLQRHRPLEPDPGNAGEGRDLTSALVFAGGDVPPADRLGGLDRAATVIAADSGLDHVLALGFAADVVVGDLDSVTPAALDRARASGAEVELHPAEKDETDLELALRRAVAMGMRRVTVIGGGGGRHDHLLANALVLGHQDYADLELDALVGTARLTVVRDRAEVRGPPGSFVSLLPLGGPAVGIHTEGLRYPLRDEELAPGSTRGVSNEFLAPIATVSLRDGVLLAVQPDSPVPALAQVVED
jgi:thiamine pyrophosphokinase